MLTDAVARLWGETPQKLTPCAASGNNQVFIAEDRDGNRVIVKRYFPLQPDERDRLDAECRFLRHAAATGRVPRLLGRDDIARIALHEWIDGEKAAPDAEALEQAADFITALNLPRPDPRSARRRRGRLHHPRTSAGG